MYGILDDNNDDDDATSRKPDLSLMDSTRRSTSLLCLSSFFTDLRLRSLDDDDISSTMMQQQLYTVDDDVYAGKSAETRHLKPGELSTGTTIMAVQFDGGVVLCAGESVVVPFRLSWHTHDITLTLLHIITLVIIISSQTHESRLGPMSRIVHLTKLHNFMIISGVVGLVQPLIHRH